MSTISILFQMLLFKAKPSDVPFNANATTIAFATAWITGVWSASLQPSNPDPLLFTLLQIVSLGAMISLFLTLNQKIKRIHQTLLASFGVIAILNIVVFILIIIPLTPLILVVGFWSFFVQVYILKNSLEVGSGQAFFMTVAIQMLTLFLASIFFPEFFQELQQQAQQRLQQQ